MICSMEAIPESVLNDLGEKIKSYISPRVRDPHTVDDITQETLIRVARHWHKYDRSKPVMPWVVTIAYNQICSHFRKEKRRLQADSITSTDVCSIEPCKHLEDMSEVVRDELAKLSPVTMEAVVLTYMHGLSEQESCKLLDITPACLKGRLRLGRATVEKLLTQSGFARRYGFV